MGPPAAVRATEEREEPRAVLWELHLRPAEAPGLLAVRKAKAGQRRVCHEPAGGGVQVQVRALGSPAAAGAALLQATAPSPVAQPLRGRRILLPRLQALCIGNIMTRLLISGWPNAWFPDTALPAPDESLWASEGCYCSWWLLSVFECCLPQPFSSPFPTDMKRKSTGVQL